jgi:hypothetical protein
MMYGYYFQNQFFTASARKSKILNISFMNAIHMLCNDICKIGTEPPDTEERVAGKTNWTASVHELPTDCFLRAVAAIEIFLTSLSSSFSCVKI